MASDNSMTISNQLCGSSMVKYIWQAKRSWPQRVLWVCNRYMLVLACFVALGSSKPMSDLLFRLGMDLEPRVLFQHPRWLHIHVLKGLRHLWEEQDYWWSDAGDMHGHDCMQCGTAQHIDHLDSAIISPSQITSLYIMPVNLPPPDNCIFVSKIDESLGFNGRH
ncbi:hypothetical protein C8Q77DRAFT_834425 [Trametes polyzona]|nr:hypothetical protein C8Q77DRAFT_834425 [Trametes polyzona]